MVSTRLKQASGPAATIIGTGWALTGWESAPGGIVLMVVGFLWTAGYVGGPKAMDALAARVADRVAAESDPQADAEVRRAIQLSLDEIELAHKLVKEALENDVWWEARRQIPVAHWFNHSGAIAAARGFESAHKAGREAHRYIEDLTHASTVAWEQIDPADRSSGVRPILGLNRRLLERAAEAFGWAEIEMNEALTRLGAAL